MISGAKAAGGGNGDGAIRCVYLTNGAVFSGFTLTNGATRGSAPSVAEESGGGVWCEATGRILSNCVLQGNSAVRFGGGAYGGTLQSCTICSNSSLGTYSILGSGGGVFGSTLRLCTLTGNSANVGGGAVESTLKACQLNGNSAFMNLASMFSGSCALVAKTRAATALPNSAVPSVWVILCLANSALRSSLSAA